MIEKLTHFDTRGRAVMVDVTAKQETSRTAIAKGRIRVSADTMTAIPRGQRRQGRRAGRGACGGHHGGEAHQRPHPHVSPADDRQNLGGLQHSGGNQRDRVRMHRLP